MQTLLPVQALKDVVGPTADIPAPGDLHSRSLEPPSFRLDIMRAALNSSLRQAWRTKKTVHCACSACLTLMSRLFDMTMYMQT